MKFTSSFRLPSSSSLRPLSASASSSFGLGVSAAAIEAASCAALRKKLLLVALDRSARFRTDLDVLLIVQFLAGLDAFAGVVLPALHYLATEATLLTLKDGDVLCYQEDRVTEDASAFVIIDGSLCGYFNRSFSERPTTSESFQVWNAKQTKRHGMLIDFGEFETTYSTGALCGFDDLLQATRVTRRTQPSPHEPLFRRRGIHAQEHTRAVVVRMDTLERLQQRFALSIDNGVLHASDTSQSDLAYLGVCSQLSEFAKAKLLQTAPRRRLVARQDVFSTLDDNDSDLSAAAATPSQQSIDALVIVLSGRLEVFWDGDDSDVADCLTTSAAGGALADSDTDTDDAVSDASPAAAAAAARARQDELVRLRRTPLAAVRCGQTFGDQALGLALDSVYAGARLTTTSAAIRVTASATPAEVIWIPRTLYDEHLREDRVSMSYHPIASATASAQQVSTAFCDWAPRFFSTKHELERDVRDVGVLARRLLVNAALTKFAFQLPPLVLERVAHALELRTFTDDTLVLKAGDALTHAFVVVHGALRLFAPASATSGDEKSLPSTEASSSALEVGTTLQQFVPGDVFGAVEFADNVVATASAVFALAETLVLTIPRVVFDRWLAPLAVDTIFDAGSTFARLEVLGESSSSTCSGAAAAAALWAPPRAHLGIDSARRQSVAQPSSSHLLELSRVESSAESSSVLSQTAAALEAAARLLHKMRVLPLVPRFVLRELLASATVVRKDAGDVLFHEGEPSALLVVLLAGYASFYSLEHMSTTLEMFQHHSFCVFERFAGSQSNPEDYVADALASDDDDVSSIVGDGPSRTTVIAKHRAAMHGVHIQTLAAGNAFRTGVLRDNTLCPATVVAQTHCECLVFDETAYAHVLKSHSAVVDVAALAAALPNAVATGTTSLTDSLAKSNDMKDDNDGDGDDVLPRLGSLRSIVVQRALAALPAPLAKSLERVPLPWLGVTPRQRQRQQLIRSMWYVRVRPGETLIRSGDVLDHVIIVLTGRLALYVQPRDDVATFLDASQRSVRSLLLERSVTSNYSTTSQQLYKEQPRSHTSGGAGNTNSSQHDNDAFAKRKLLRTKLSRIAGGRQTGLFVDSVLVAVHEERLQRSSVVVGGATPNSSGELAQTEATTTASAMTTEPTGAETDSGGQNRSRSANRVRSGLALHSAAAKLRMQHKIASQRTTFSASNDGNALLLCYFGPGEVYGAEVLAPHGVFHSVHDVVVCDAPPLATSSATTTTTTTGGAQLLLLDRRAFHAVASKSDDEIANDLRARSQLVKLKWRRAERKVVRKLSQTTASSDAKPPKLFELFRNILNQRCALTLRTLADIPQLRDVSDASKQALSLAARFEALERGMNAYNENGAAHSSSSARYYLLLHGRIALCAKSLSSATGSTGSTASTTVAGTEHCLREVLPGTGFGEFELLVPECPRCIAAVALEPCRLLTFPAAAFLKHWSHVAAMQSDIAYLRLRVPFFARLELERIAYLYTTLTFETLTRGSNIFEQSQAIASRSASNTGELYLLKEGTCSIRQRVVVEMQQPSSVNNNMVAIKPGAAASRGRHHRTAASAPTPSMRVMVTVADVSDGHLFWLDSATYPFTLQVKSASLTVTRLAVDKLRAVLPRTQFAAIERSSRALQALHVQQVAIAKRAVVALLNEQQAAHSGELAHAMFLPALTQQTPIKVVPSGGSSRSDPTIPFSRLLMARPVDLAALRTDDARATDCESVLPSDKLASRRGRSDSSDADVAYRKQHAREYYELEPGLPNATLVGSFPDDAVLWQRQQQQSAFQATSSRSRTNASILSATGAKEDERMAAEHVTSRFEFVNREAAGTRLRDATSYVHVKVTVPTSSNPTLCCMPTPPTSARSTSRGPLATALMLTPRSIRCSPAIDAIASVPAAGAADYSIVDLEVDVRELLRVEMAAADAPMRTLKLAPSLSKANALGQYLVLASAPTPTTPTEPLQLASRAPAFQASAPMHLFAKAAATATACRAAAAVSMTPVVSFPVSTQPSFSVPAATTSSTSTTLALVRKQGFLYIALLADASSFATGLPRTRKRRFVAVVDATFVEFADTVMRSEVVAGHSTGGVAPLYTRYLDARSAGSSVCDAPVPNSASEVDKAILRLSFVLVVDSATTMLLTAESTAEKQLWINALHHACALGPRATPLHQPLSPLSVLTPGPIDSPTFATTANPSRHQARIGSTPHGVENDLELHVEYRIG